METASFIFGMLTIVVSLFMITIVVGLVKIHKLQKQVYAHERQIEDCFRLQERRFEDTHQRISEFMRENDHNVGHRFENIERYITDTREDLHKEIEDVHKQDVSYVDSRVDKLEAKLQGELESSKKLIRG